MSKTLYAVLNCLALVVTLTVNALAVYLPLNDMSTGDVADLYPSLFTPAGLTFSIWSVIYLLLIGFVVYQWKGYVENTGVTLTYFARLSMWFILSCLLNAAWIFAWHYLYTALSVAIMLLFLFALVRIFLLLQERPPQTFGEKLWVKTTFTIYLAWICVATIANISAFLTSLSFEGGPIPAPVWTAVMMTVAAALAIFFLYRFRAAAFAVVVLWALLGIYIRWHGDYTLITTTGIVLMAVVFVFTVYTLFTTGKNANTQRS